MAILEGIFPLKGTIGNVTFVRTKNGVYRAQRKTSMDKKRIMTDPDFQRVRENLAEFKRAASAGSLLREVFKTQIKQVKREKLVSRLMTKMIEAVKLDSVNPRGQRQVLDAETELLEGFQFNMGVPLSSALPIDYTVTADRVTGVLEIAMPSFIPSIELVVPEYTTHFKLIAVGAAIGFEDEVFVKEEASSAILPWDTNPTGPITLTANLPANSPHPLFMLLGVCYFLEDKGTKYPLKNGLYNSLAIVKVAGV
jgi:hypothetical protein